MKNMNEDYLIQMYDQAREKMLGYAYGNSGQDYWRGIQDTYHKLLCMFHPGWSAQGTIGYYVFIENMTYFNAFTKVNRATKPTMMFGSGSHARRAS